MTRYEVDVRAVVTIDIDFDKAPDALSRCGDDDWKRNLYPDIVDDEGMLSMLAYNAVANGINDANRLDGWGDLERGVITMRVEDVYTEGTYGG